MKDRDNAGFDSHGGSRFRDRDPLILLAGHVARFGTQFLLLWVVARAGGVMAASQFAASLAVSSPIFMFAEMGLAAVYQTLVGGVSFRAVFLVRIVLSASALGLVTGLSLLPLDGFSRDLLVFVAVGRFFDSVIDISNARLRHEGRAVAVACAAWVNAVVTGLAVSGVLAWTGVAQDAVLLSACVSGLVAIAMSWPLLAGETGASWSFTRDEARRVVRAGSAVGIQQTLLSLFAFLPVYYLTIGGAPGSVGLFATARYWYVAAGTFFTSAEQAWLGPIRTSRALSGREGVESLARRFNRIAVGCGLAAGILSLPLIVSLTPILFGAEFRVSLEEALPLSVAIVALGFRSVPSLVLLVANRYGTYLRLSMVSMIAAGIVAALTVNSAHVAMAGYITATGVIVGSVLALVAWRRLLGSSQLDEG